MQKTRNSDIQFFPQTILKGTLNNADLNKRRIPEFGKIKLPSRAAQNNWIQKDLKYKIGKWSLNKVFIPSERSMDMNKIAERQKSKEQ